MCIICVSPARTRQPSISQIKMMFQSNPHGAGYMYARDGRVHIHKGFMDIDSFLSAVKAEHFTAKDSVVYHFRISTQAGVNPEMTHAVCLSEVILCSHYAASFFSLVRIRSPSTSVSTLNHGERKNPSSCLSSSSAWVAIIGLA